MPEKKFSLKEKLVFAFLTVVLVSLFLSILSSYSLFLYNLSRKLDPELQATSQIVDSRFDEQKDRILIYADLVSKDPTVIGFVKGEKSRTQLEESLKILSSRLALSGIGISSEQGINVFYVGNSNLNKLSEGLAKDAQKRTKASSYENINGYTVVQAWSPIQENGNYHGYAVVSYLVNDSFLELLEKSLDEEISIFDPSGKLIATTVKNEIGETIKTQTLNEKDLMAVKSMQPSSNGKITIGNVVYKAIYTPLKSSDGRIIAIKMTALSLRSVFTDNSLIIISLIIANLFAIFIAYILATRNSKRLADPILAIKKGAEIISKGMLHYKINVKTHDEVEDLATSFNDMTSKLKGLIEEVSQEKDTATAERNKFSVVLEGVRDGIFTLDFDRKITLFNKAAQEITGLTEEDVIGKKCDEVLIVFRNRIRLPATDFCPLTPVVKDQVVFSDKNLRLVTAKKEIYISMMSAAIKQGKLANLGCIVTFRDTSKERELEEMKLDFVSMAAHELRTPLTTIRGYISLLEPRIKDVASEEDFKFLERVSIASNQLAALVENLLNVSKIERNAMELDIKAENWVEIVKSVVQDFQEQAKQKEITLVFNEPSYDFPMVAADKFRITEVISNLLANAITYTNNKGKVEVSLSHDENIVTTSVRDTGIGIPERSIQHLFTKFYRVSTSLEQGAKGTGLGLFISKSIVNMHKGEIWVESQVGVGSTFTFTLPIYNQ